MKLQFHYQLFRRRDSSSSSRLFSKHTRPIRARRLHHTVASVASVGVDAALLSRHVHPRSSITPHCRLSGRLD